MADIHLPYINHIAYRCALVSQAVYHGDSLPQYGLPLATQKQINSLFAKPFYVDDSNNIKERFYYDERTDSLLLAFAGTEAFNADDWKTNLSQFFGDKPEYYQQGIKLAESVNTKKRNKVICTGHSLGGGVATIAAIAGRMEAFVFNPASIHENNLSDFTEKQLALAEGNVERFIVKGEILDMWQQLYLTNQHKLIGTRTNLSGSWSIPWSSIVSPAALLRKFIPVAGPVIGIASPVIEKMIWLHTMEEVLYGLRQHLPVVH